MVLVGSGRIGEEEWAAVLAESVETRSVHAALVARGVEQVDALALAAVQDAAFAVAAGGVERVVVDEVDEVPLLAVAGGVAPDVLVRETGRRLDEVAALAVAVAPYRDRVVAVRGAEEVLGAGRREIVAQATGRRTARDIAFAVGAGLHPVVVGISLMLGEGLLEIASPEVSFSFSHGGLRSLGPRVEAGERPG
ncbi:hypothetical protein BBK82_07005 [Lentzea guizhouensis]|uniref:Uncharacterized protein n=1 Tax=Lentzea guizhouensis TaxID=1586287 RepID=A0A1B2HDU5_9PSEU|nr:hypothetical protein BBK82_07005 [Lentzea guizhouensis]